MKEGPKSRMRGTFDQIFCHGVAECPVTKRQIEERLYGRTVRGGNPLEGACKASSLA